MSRLNLIIDPSDFATVLRPFVKTRRRLIVATTITVAITLLIGYSIIYYILELSVYPTLNLFLILLMAFTLLPSSLFLTILIGEYFFSPSWRRDTFLKPEVIGTLKDHNLEFTIILGLLFVSQALLLNFTTGNFLSTYNEETFFEVKYKDPDPKVRIWTLKQLASPFRYSSWERDGVRKLVVSSLDDPDADVAATGAYLIGFIGIPEAKDLLSETVADRNKSATTRASAAVALAKIDPSETTRMLLENVSKAPTNNTRVRIGALRGLAYINSSLSATVVMKVAEENVNNEIGVNAFYALRTIPSPKTRTWAREIVEKNEDKKIRCPVFDLLKFIATTDDVNWARRLFLSTNDNYACKEEVWEEPDETKHYISYEDTVKVKLVKIVANSAGKDERAWYERLIRDNKQPSEVREIAGKVLKQLGN